MNQLKEKANKFKGSKGDKRSQSRKRLHISKMRKAILNKGENEDEDKKTTDLSMDCFHQLYEAYQRKEENLSGELNTKQLGSKNQEFRLRMEVWAENQELRAKNERRVVAKEEIVNKIIDKYDEDINLDNHLVKECRNQFQQAMTERRVVQHLE